MAVWAKPCNPFGYVWATVRETPNMMGLQIRFASAGCKWCWLVATLAYSFSTSQHIDTDRLTAVSDSLFPLNRALYPWLMTKERVLADSDKGWNQRSPSWVDCSIVAPTKASYGGKLEYDDATEHPFRYWCFAFLVSRCIPSGRCTAPFSAHILKQMKVFPSSAC